MPATGYKKVTFCCSITLTTLSKCLGTEDTNSWIFESEILSFSFLIYDFSCSRVQGVPCHSLCFIMQGVQSGTHVIALWSHTLQNVACHCFAGISRDIYEKDLTWCHYPQVSQDAFADQGLFTIRQRYKDVGQNHNQKKTPIRSGDRLTTHRAINQNHRSAKTRNKT